MSPQQGSAAPLAPAVDLRNPAPAPSRSEPAEGTIEARVWRDLDAHNGQTLAELTATMSANLSVAQVRNALRKLQRHGLAECRHVQDMYEDHHYYWHKRGAE